ncbi:hypothetical protein TNCV_76961 [Trichonephila clavipes]|nr:hypothetical protein TNCV_76961 [Trichonephila clavipes]
MSRSKFEFVPPSPRPCLINERTFEAQQNWHASSPLRYTWTQTHDTTAMSQPPSKTINLIQPTNYTLEE